MTSSAKGLFEELESIYTVKEAALICQRAPKTIRNLIYRHNLAVRYGRQPVRRGKGMRRRILLLSPMTVRALRRLTLGV